MITFLKWDSNFFRKKIARVTIDADYTPEVLNETIKILFRKKYDCAYLMISGDRGDLLDYCREKHFFLADQKLLMKKKTERFTAESFINIKTNLSVKEQSVFKDLVHQIAKVSRFYKDLNFRPFAYKLYEKWLFQSLKKRPNHKCFFARKDNIPVGLITLKLENNNPYIDLFGVDRLYRKKEIGTTLLKTADTWANNKGYNNIFVTTQADNNIAIIVYKKYGFKEENTTYIFHIWHSYAHKNSF